MSEVLPITENPRYAISTATEGQTEFSVPFPFQANADVVVVKIVDGAETTLAEGEDYTLTGAEDAAGGTVTLLVAGGATAGDQYLRYGQVVLDRLNAITRAGKFSSKATDDDLDRAILALQEARRDLGRAVKAKMGQAGPSIEAGDENVIPVFDAAGNLVPGPIWGDEIGGPPGAPGAPGEKGDKGDQGDPGPAGASGFETLAAAVADNPATASAFTRTAGRDAAGDRGGALYRLAVSEPVHAGKYQNAAGSWYEIAERELTPEMFGAVGTGDETAKLAELFAVADAVGATARLTAGKTYTFSQLSIPAGLVLQARGAVLRSDGSLTVAGDITLDLGDGVRFDDLYLSTPGTETNTHILQLGAGVVGERIVLRADAQRAGGGIVATGQDVRIGILDTDKIDRPLLFDNTGGGAPTTGSHVGLLYLRSYVRGFRAIYCNDWSIDRYDMAGRSANASVNPGHNGFLISGCAGWAIGDGTVADAGEHAFRIGGSDAGGKTEKAKVGHFTAIRSGGCAFKINPTTLVSAGVTETADNIEVAGVTGIDIGEGASAGNTELLRLTHCRHLSIGYAHGYADGETTSAQHGAQFNDDQDVFIGSLGGSAFRGGLFNTDETSDCDGVNQFGGAVEGLRIGRLWGTCVGSHAINFAPMQSFDIGDVHVDDMDIEGFTTDVINFYASQTFSGRVFVKGRVLGAVSPVFTNAPDNDNSLVDIDYAGSRYIGRPASYRQTNAALHVRAAGTFSIATGTPGAGALHIAAPSASAGSGSYGGAVEFSRPGSARRLAAIAAKQTTANAYEGGIAFFRQASGSVANEAVAEGMVLNHAGALAVTGALSKGSGTFLIDHPLDPENRDLIHGFIEGPRYDLLYRGRAKLKKGKATVDIDAASRLTPGTFAALTQNAEVASLGNRTGFARVRGSEVDHGRFEIVCEDNSSEDEIVWVVLAERADPFIVNGDPWTDGDGQLIPEHDKPDDEGPRTVTITDDDGKRTIEVVRQGVRGHPRHAEFIAARRG